MTNFERIKNMTEEEMAEFLCMLFDNDGGDDKYISCEHCICQGFCAVKDNGFRRWLRKENYDDSAT